MKRWSLSLTVWLALLVGLGWPVAMRAQLILATNSDGTIAVTGYTGPLTNLVIPSTTNGYPVTSIAEAAFLAKVTLVTVSIPDSVTNIGAGAFNSCGFTNVTVPASVLNIGDYAFFYCTNLVAITVASGNPAYSSVDGVLFDKDQTVLRQFPFGKGGSYTIPGTVTQIADEAFGVNDWDGDYYYTPVCIGLTNLVVPESLVNLPTNVFRMCVGLESVTLPAGLTNIGNSAFAECFRLKTMAVSDSVLTIGYDAFASCTNLTSITLGGGLTSIGDYAFTDCTALTNVVLPAGLTSIGNYTFQGCLLDQIVLPDSVQNVGEGAFQYCWALTRVDLDDHLTNIDSSAFLGCAGLTNVTIPDAVTSIGSQAFGECSGLISATIGAGVANFGDGVFTDCADLTDVFFRGDAPTNQSDFSFDGNVYSVKGQETVLYLPGTIGWSTNFYGRPTALWLPQVQAVAGAGAGAGTNGFGFDVSWASGQTVVVEACTNLTNPVWVPVETNLLTTGSVKFSDAQWGSYPGRYYRVRSE